MDSLEDLSRRAAGSGNDYGVQAAHAKPWFVGNGRAAMLVVLALLAALTVVRLFTVAWLMDLAWGWSLHQPLPDVVDRWLFPGARPARPIDRASWLTKADYPKASFVFAPSGTTVIRLAVSAQGRPSDCWTHRSSNSSILDDTACSLVMRRARYIPARDADGRAVPSEEILKVRWEAPPVAIRSGRWRAVADFKSGKPPECQIVADGRAEPMAAGDCTRFVTQMQQMLSVAPIAPAVRVAQDSLTAMADLPPPPLDPPQAGWRPIVDIRNRAFLAQGYMRQCHVEVDVDDDVDGAAVRRSIGKPPGCEPKQRFVLDGRPDPDGHLLTETRISVQGGVSS